MSYKTILVHVDDARNAATRIELAARMARTEDAHLIGSALTGVSRALFEAAMSDFGAMDIEQYLQALRQRTQHALTPFEDIARRVGVASFEKRMTDNEFAGGLSLQARYCDLVVLGQYDPNAASPAVQAAVPQYVALNGGCPVLVVPHSGTFASVGQRVLLAWNGSIEAAHAVHAALPVLHRAQAVDVVAFNPGSNQGEPGEQPGAEIALFLGRHGIKANVMQESTRADIGDALLSRASDLNADLLVMGCYGHSRFREVLLGGATRTVLQSLTLPVLMSH